MALILRAGVYQIMCQHIQQKKPGGVWYYRRRIPKHALRLHTETERRHGQVYFSLKTRDPVEAGKAADKHTQRYELLWTKSKAATGSGLNPELALARLEAAGLQVGDGPRHPDSVQVNDFINDLIGPREQFEENATPSAQEELTYQLLFGAGVPRTLADAKKEYVRLGKGPRNPKAQGQWDRAWAVFDNVVGNAILTTLRREHANRFTNILSQRGLTKDSIEKYLAQIRPVVTLAIREFELDMVNPFIKVVVPPSKEGRRREPFSLDQLRAIVTRCRAMDDQRRWAIAMMVDTGARNAEIAGLLKEEVILDAPFPHIIIQPNRNRRLKNDQSERKVPLVGCALWAAQCAMRTEGPHLFPVFQPKTAGKEFNADGVSAALNKWLKKNALAHGGQSLHSFRHSMRDRLRDVLATPEIIDRIGGWKTAGIGESYGRGQSLATLVQPLIKMAAALGGEEVGAKSNL